MEQKIELGLRYTSSGAIFRLFQLCEPIGPLRLYFFLLLSSRLLTNNPLNRYKLNEQMHSLCLLRLAYQSLSNDVFQVKEKETYQSEAEPGLR